MGSNTKFTPWVPDKEDNDIWDPEVEVAALSPTSALTSSSSSVPRRTHVRNGGGRPLSDVDEENEETHTLTPPSSSGHHGHTQQPPPSSAPNSYYNNNSPGGKVGGGGGRARVTIDPAYGGRIPRGRIYRETVVPNVHEDDLNLMGGTRRSIAGLSGKFRTKYILLILILVGLSLLLTLELLRTLHLTRTESVSGTSLLLESNERLSSSLKSLSTQLLQRDKELEGVLGSLGSESKLLNQNTTGNLLTALEDNRQALQVLAESQGLLMSKSQGAAANLHLEVKETLENYTETVKELLQDLNELIKELGMENRAFHATDPHAPPESGAQAEADMKTLKIHIARILDETRRLREMAAEDDMELKRNSIRRESLQSASSGCPKNRMTLWISTLFVTLGYLLIM